jgi:hypothetical protein
MKFREAHGDSEGRPRAAGASRRAPLAGSVPGFSGSIAFMKLHVCSCSREKNYVAHVFHVVKALGKGRAPIADATRPRGLFSVLLTSDF